MLVLQRCKSVHTRSKISFTQVNSIKLILNNNLEYVVHAAWHR
jgi:hypothetical protein